jgi:uncharacterized membrane protein
LIPFVTGWMGENHFAQLPVAMYGVVLLMSSIAFKLLVHLLVKNEGPDSELAKALRKDFKGNISPILYSLAIAASFINRWLAVAIYVVVSIMWIIPDSRIERTHNV